MRFVYTWSWTCTLVGAASAALFLLTGPAWSGFNEPCTVTFKSDSGWTPSEQGFCFYRTGNEWVSRTRNFYGWNVFSLYVDVAVRPARVRVQVQESHGCGFVAAPLPFGCPPNRIMTGTDDAGRFYQICPVSVFPCQFDLSL